MRSFIIAVLVTSALLGAPPSSSSAAAISVPEGRAGTSHHCPDALTLVDKAPLVTGTGQRMGVAMLFAGQSTQTQPASPGFCLEVSVKKRYRKPFAPLRKKLSVASPVTTNPNVVGTTEPSARQSPIATYASYFGPGCTARGKTVITVGTRRATAVVTGAI